MQPKCDICGKDSARVRLVTRTYGKGASILVIENVPAVSCSSCGQSYLDAETLFWTLRTVEVAPDMRA